MTSGKNHGFSVRHVSSFSASKQKGGQPTKKSVFDKELTNVSKKVLKQYRAGYVLCRHPGLSQTQCMTLVLSAFICIVRELEIKPYGAYNTSRKYYNTSKVYNKFINSLY